MSKKVREKKSWKRRLLIAAGLLVLLLVACYFALSSTVFVRQFILPRVGELIGAEITLADTVIQPFSRIELRELRVQTGDREPVLEIERLRARYDGWALLRGRVVIEECEIIAPRLQVLRVAGGRGNLPLLWERKQPRDPAPAPRAGGRAAGPGLSVRNVSLTNAFVRIVDRNRAGLDTATTLSNLTMSLDRLANGEPGKVVLGADVHCARGAAVGGSNDFFVARADGSFDFETTAVAALGRLEGRAQFGVTSAGGTFRDLAALQGRLDTLFEGNRITRGDLVFEQRGVTVGKVQATGPFNPAKSEGQLRVTIDSLNRQVLNLLAGRYGLEFQQSAIGADVALGFAQGGAAVTASGQIVGRQLAVRRAGPATPALDAQLDFDLRTERLAQRLHLQKFDLTARHGTNVLLTSRLDYPVEFSWASNTVASFTKATLRTGVSQFELAAWPALHGRTNLHGQVDAQVALSATPGDARLQWAVTASARGLGAGTWRQGNLEATLAGVYARTNKTEDFAGTLSVRAPATTPGDLIPPGLVLEAEFEAARGNDALDLRRMKAHLRRGAAPAGEAGLEGQWQPVAGVGEFRLKLSDFNQLALGPLLDPQLAPRALASVRLDGDALVRAAGGGLTTFDATATVREFSVAPMMAGRARPEATLRLSASSDGSVHQLKRLVLNLAPGTQPANELEATGTLDLRADKPEASRLALKSAALDLTAWWDALAPAAPPAPARGDRAAPAPRQDPGPVVAPVRQLALEARLDRVTARRIVATNIILSARLSDGLLAVKPLEATINGAPARGLIDANLGVPGWLYNVDLAVDRLPLAPLADSFAPGAPTAPAGDLALQGEFKGAGLTYETLRHKLAGTAQFTLTNAALAFAPGWKQGVLVTVATLLRTPEIAGGPIAWSTGGLTVGGGQLDLKGVNLGTDAFIAGITGRVPLTEALTNSPLDLPVSLQLRRSLADRAKLAVAGPPDAPYAALPDFLRARGTLGQPTARIDKAALGGVVLQSLGNIPGLTGEKTGAILQGIGGLLAPKSPATNQPPAPPPAPKQP